MMGAWALLVTAIAVEVAATSLLPRTLGFRDPLWTVATVGGYAVSIWLLSVVVQRLPVSITYAVWAGLGTAGVALVGVFLLGERLGPPQAAGLALIMGGVVILNLTAHP